MSTTTATVQRTEFATLNAIRTAASAILPALSVDKARKNLMSALLDVHGETYDLVATDGRRMHVYTGQCTASAPFRVMIPRDALKLLAKVKPYHEPIIEVTFDPNETNGNGVPSASVLISMPAPMPSIEYVTEFQTFPSWRMVVPKETPERHKFFVKANDIKPVIEVAARFHTDRYNHIEMHITEGTLNILQKNEYGHAQYKPIPVDTGDNQEVPDMNEPVGIDPNFLLDTIKAFGKYPKPIHVLVCDCNSPFHLTSPFHKEFQAVIMPVRLG